MQEFFTLLTKKKIIGIELNRGQKIKFGNVVGALKKWNHSVLSL